MTSSHPIRIAPSLLSADFARLADDVRRCEEGGADILHVDVMDGHFVPNITIGPLVVRALKPVTSLPMDCHLMITNPDDYIEDFAAAGASWISVHAEVAHHLHRTLTRIRELGCRPGVVLNPVTPIETAMAAAGEADFILLMSVNPGFGGQSFIPSFLSRCERLRTWLDNNGLSSVEIEVDGGVKIDNVRSVVDAGANIIVSGSGLFGGDLSANIRTMRAAAER
ncbi:MAG: ribulose-phosphate 3-epimerase ['Candidatus Kapabacteria' thiocyanatum]|uniref:Ribulose-phosphate 3-epimerase n=1 Tax=Candidatus Kapaibacterium thiocyanatum TaxID=1895771 RepID=A0A1M3KX78_9BACT|nr:ribulose-phosphate 3-epimerase ['Candidatus Kapabacteria' thiocyanatum]OJX56839.1 MAG: ribulose-phosphate 3-epimerase ['Candidatus Kapabacteria' thiocyanatum]